jgi:PAS domain-containing protein
LRKTGCSRLRFAVCIDNDGYEASLERNKILEVNLAVSQLLGLRRDEVLERRSLASSLLRRQRSSSPLCGKSSSAV